MICSTCYLLLQEATSFITTVRNSASILKRRSFKKPNRPIGVKSSQKLSALGLNLKQETVDGMKQEVDSDEEKLEKKDCSRVDIKIEIDEDHTMNSVPEIEVNRIIHLYKKQEPVSEISRMLGIPMRHVQFCIEQYISSGSMDPLAPDPLTEYSENSSPHPNTIVNVLFEPDYNSRVDTQMHQQMCPKLTRTMILTQDDQEQRVRFAKDYLHYNWTDNIIIFTAKITFTLEAGYRLLWRFHGAKNTVTFNLSQEIDGHIALGYWGWMSSMGPGELVKIERSISNNTYMLDVDIIENAILPTIRIVYPNEKLHFVFDNCSGLTSNIKRRLKIEEDVFVIDWPAKNSDLNPMETLWEHLVLNLDLSNVKCNADLDKLVTSRWDSLRGTDTWWNMITKMSERLQAVIDCNGGRVS